MGRGIVHRNWQNATVKVRTNVSTFECVVGPCDCCNYCAQYIVWGMDKKGRPVALQPWPDGENMTEVHYVYCEYRDLDEREEPCRRRTAA